MTVLPVSQSCLPAPCGIAGPTCKTEMKEEIMREIECTDKKKVVCMQAAIWQIRRINQALAASRGTS